MRSNFWLIRPTGIKEREDTNKGIKETLTQKNIPKKKKNERQTFFQEIYHFFNFRTLRIKTISWKLSKINQRKLQSI